MWFRFCAMDWGWAKPYSIGFYAVNSQGRLIRYRELYGCKQDEYNVGVKKESTKLAQEAWEFASLEGIKDMVADPAIWSNENNQCIMQDFADVGFNMVPANNDRINGLVMVDQIFKQTVDQNGTPMFQVFNTCKAFIRTIPMLTPNPNHPEDIDTKLEDHVYDEFRYAVMSDFVMHPTTHLRKVNGSWRPQRQTKEWDPF